VVCVHQDMYLPRNLDKWLAEQISLLEQPDFGVLGVYGTLNKDEGRGKVVDRTLTLRRIDSWVPQRVKTLDEIVLVVRKKALIQFDESLGWHLYGADICVNARAKGYFVGVIDAPCFHNSLFTTLPAAFFDSAKVLGNKWEAKWLPIETSCGDIGPEGILQT
jgi:hypothetical protein